MSVLLQVAGLARSVYYYQRQVSLMPDKHAQIKEAIKQVFHAHKGRYGYRRVTLALRNMGYQINHKTVQRLMIMMGLKSRVRPKRYKSYRGNVGKVADNVLSRDFSATKPNQKWVTDVTEFNVSGQKVYLSPIIDLFSLEVVSYQIQKSAHLPLVVNMLNQAIAGLQPEERPLIHSDQGWQYQHWAVRSLIKGAGLTQSMSRKGNCLDNAVAESFFGILKSEMYHGCEFKDADDLIKQLHGYIDYYNNKRIKQKLKGLTPVQYRYQALEAA